MDRTVRHSNISLHHLKLMRKDPAAPGTLSYRELVSHVDWFNRVMASYRRNTTSNGFFRSRSEKFARGRRGLRDWHGEKPIDEEFPMLTTQFFLDKLRADALAELQPSQEKEVQTTSVQEAACQAEEPPIETATISTQTVEDKCIQVDMDAEMDKAVDKFKNYMRDHVVTLKQMASTFVHMDKNGDGSISASELGEVLGDQLPEETFSSQEIEHIIRSVDLDGNGSIEYNEFYAMMGHTEVRSRKRSALLHAAKTPSTPTTPLTPSTPIPSTPPRSQLAAAKDSPMSIRSDVDDEDDDFIEKLAAMKERLTREKLGIAHSLALLEKAQEAKEKPPTAEWIGM